MNARDTKLRSTVAALRRAARDANHQDRLLTAAQRLRAMLPGDDRYGDTLSLSGREPNQLVGKTLAVIEPREDSVLRELGLTALQLWEQTGIHGVAEDLSDGALPPLPTPRGRDALGV